MTRSLRLVPSSRDRRSSASTARPAAVLAALEHLPNIHRFDGRPGRDAELVRQFMSAREPRPLYGNSWLYLTQAANGARLGARFGYRYFDGERLAAIGFFQRPQAPVDSYHFHLIRPAGGWTRAHLEELCAALRDLSGTPVYIKKLTEDQHHSWSSGRFKPVVGYDWHPAAPEEDDTFPEAIVDVQGVLRLLSAAAPDNELRRKFRRFERDHRGALQREPYSGGLLADAWRVVEAFFADARVLRHDLSSPLDYRNMLESLPAGRNGHEFFATLLRIDAEPVALLIADTIGPGVAGVYANMTVPGAGRGLSEYLLLSAFRDMADAGIVIANLGGSETQGLQEFKRKFRPVAESKMFWLVYD